MAATKHWTDGEVDALCQAAYMCGLATGNKAFGCATVGPRSPEFMPAFHDAVANPTPRNRRKALALADVLLGHVGGVVRRLARDVKLDGHKAAMGLWFARAKGGA